MNAHMKYRKKILDEYHLAEDNLGKYMQSLRERLPAFGMESGFAFNVHDFAKLIKFQDAYAQAAWKLILCIENDVCDDVHMNDLIESYT